MTTTIILCLLVASALRSAAVPVATVMGCKHPTSELSAEKAKFCCEQFNMGCTAEESVSVRSDGTETDRSPKSIVNKSDLKSGNRKKSLGAPCRRFGMDCAVGLECRRGYCFRKRSRAHLEELMDRGKAIEIEEELKVDEGTDEETGDPLPAQKGLILHGQSVDVGDKVPLELLKTNESGGTSAWPSVKHVRGEAANKNRTAKTETGGQSGAQKRITYESEETELANNIGDLLASKLGLALNAAEMKGIRELIAGTIDEREEREDELEEEVVDAEKVAVVSTPTVRKNENPGRNGHRRNQCPSADEHDSLVTKTAKAVSDKIMAVAADAVHLKI